MREIRRVAVLGAGTMGSGIASHLANAGVFVHLLDLPDTGSAGRNAVAESAISRQLRSQPPGFVHASYAERITPGNIEDDLQVLRDADWIIEAVVERLEVKEQLYRIIEEHRAPDSVVSSNTSTIPLRLLTRRQSAEFRNDFCITHFFNPVRYMRLLEIVPGPDTRAEVIAQLVGFCDNQLGKGVVVCQDTPGFLGNRVGVFAIQLAVREAMDCGLKIEDADALLGRSIGWPKTGVFRLYDLIGVDLMLDVLASMRQTLPSDDPLFHVAEELPLLRRMVDAGRTGNKAGGGFYRRLGPELQALELSSESYRAVDPTVRTPVDGGDLRGQWEVPGKYGDFRRRVLSQTLSYAASLVPDVAGDPVAVDEAMKLGFSWQCGPFEMIDQIGSDWFAEQLIAAGRDLPPMLASAQGRSFYRAEGDCLQFLSSNGEYQDVPRPPGVLRLSDRKSVSKPRLRGRAASLWDIGDGIACFEFHTKANALVPETMELLTAAIETVANEFQGLIIHNDGAHFSVGVNLQQVADAARREDGPGIERMLADFQETCLNLKYASFPVLGAPSGLALGGGFEVLLHCDGLVAHTNTVLGLVETRVGLVPAGGGCKETLLRRSATDATSPEGVVSRVFRQIAPGQIAHSPVEARPLCYFVDGDTEQVNRDRILAATKKRISSMVDTYQPPAPRTIIAAGPAGTAMCERIMEEWQDAGQLTCHDRVVGRELACVLSGGDVTQGTAVSERHMLDLERQAFLRLIQLPDTQARIDHMLRTGKPLRN